MLPDILFHPVGDSEDYKSLFSLFAKSRMSVFCTLLPEPQTQRVPV